MTHETNPGPAADDLFQLRVPHGKTPAERRADFTKVLTDFLRTNPKVGTASEIRSARDVKEVMRSVASGRRIYTPAQAKRKPGDPQGGGA